MTSQNVEAQGRKARASVTEREVGNRKRGRIAVNDNRVYLVRTLVRGDSFVCPRWLADTEDTARNAQPSAVGEHLIDCHAAPVLLVIADSAERYSASFGKLSLRPVFLYA